MSACPVCALPEGHAGYCTFSEFDPPDVMPSIGRNEAAAPANVPAVPPGVPPGVPGAAPGSWIPSGSGLSIGRRREAYGFAAAGLRHAAASFARSPSSWVPTPEVVDRAGKALALSDARKPDAVRFNARGAVHRELGFAGRYEDSRRFALTVAWAAFRQAIDAEVPRTAQGKPDLLFNWETQPGRSVDDVVAKLRAAAHLCDAEIPAAAPFDPKRRALEAAARIQGGEHSRAAFDALEYALVALCDAAAARGAGVDAVTAACVQHNVLADRAPLCTEPEVAHLVHLVRGALEAVP